MTIDETMSDLLPAWVRALVLVCGLGCMAAAQQPKQTRVAQEAETSPAHLISFDDPQLEAGKKLVGQYPRGVVDWGPGAWKIAPPVGKFATLNLKLSDPSGTAEFRFSTPRVFVGMDVYNSGQEEARVTLLSPEKIERSIPIAAGQLLKLRTGWHTPSSIVMVQADGAGLRFDNWAWETP